MQVRSTTGFLNVTLAFGKLFVLPNRRAGNIVLTAVLLCVDAALAAQTPQALGYSHPQFSDTAAYLYYTDIKTILDEPMAELLRKYDDLKHLQPARSQAELPLLLQKTGQNVKLLFENFPNTSCQESIREVRLRNFRSVDSGFTHTFNYIILPETANGVEEFREFRTDSKGRPVDPSTLKGASMTTIGFASMPLVFLPRYQSQSRFRYLGTDEFKKHQVAYVVAFSQIFKKAQEIGYVNIAGKTALILTQGMAWIDPKTFNILRMRTDLLAPRPDILLDRQTTDIEFKTVKFKNSSATLWLPRQVTVDLIWNNVTFENTHTYSRFRLFNVETDETVSADSKHRKR